jgi:hypothetical protein
VFGWFALQILNHTLQILNHALQILNDARTRKRYDYALAHPEENIQQEEAYGIWKYWKTDARAVLIGFVLIVSIIQYYAKKSSYDAVLPETRMCRMFIHLSLSIVVAIASANAD